MKRKKELTILGIETSCDDTGIALLKIKKNKKKTVFETLSNIVASQIKIHKKYGGVYPSLAKREHQKNLIPIFKKSLKQANLLKKFQPQNEKDQKILNSKIIILEKILKREKELFEELKKFLEKYKKPKINAIAVTVGPGLEPCLWVGINFAKALAFFWNLPLITINHIEAHILINFLYQNIQFPISKKTLKEIFPAISLIVSGGHTQLILLKDIGKYRLIGETRDDAAGECFDKCARILGLGYPGGPEISISASKKTTENLEIKLPRPMIYTKDYDFSFSGLKTAVLYKIKKAKSKIKNKNYISAMSKEIQQAIIDVLIKKTIKSAKDYKTKTIILAGGVSANNELRFQLTKKAKEKKIKIFIPPKKLSTDNALMVALAGYFNYNKKIKVLNKFPYFEKKIEAKGNLKIK